MIRRKQGAAELENGHGTDADSDCENIDPPCCCYDTPNCLDLVDRIEVAKPSAIREGFRQRPSS